MKNKNLWCQWPMKPLDDNSKCGVATVKGAELCVGHESQCPIWPVNPDGSLLVLDGVVRVTWDIIGTLKASSLGLGLYVVVFLALCL